MEAEPKAFSIPLWADGLRVPRLAGCVALPTALWGTLCAAPGVEGPRTEQDPSPRAEPTATLYPLQTGVAQCQEEALRSHTPQGLADAVASRRRSHGPPLPTIPSPLSLSRLPERLPAGLCRPVHTSLALPWGLVLRPLLRGPWACECRCVSCPTPCHPAQTVRCVEMWQSQPCPSQSRGEETHSPAEQQGRSS